MKISEMTNEQAADALIRLSVPFGNICEDEEAIKLIEEFETLKDKPMIYTIGKLLPKLVNYALKAHKEDLYEIVGALTFQTKEKVSKMKFFDTIKVFQDSYDEVLNSFFTSSVKQMKDSAEALSQE